MPSVVRDKYHTTDSILHGIADLEKSCPYIVKHEIQAFDASSSGMRSNSAYTLTDPNTPKDNKKRFMLTFGMHGREYISSEAALALSRYVCQKTSSEGSVAALAVSSTSTPKKDNLQSSLIPESFKGPKLEEPKPAQQQAPAKTATGAQANVELNAEAQQGDAMSKDRLLNILKTTEIVFIPVVNIDGRKKVESGASCTEQRKNGRNVDINRNFADWFNPNNAAPSEEDYQGPTSMSEWETNIIKTLADSFRPHAFIDIHSGDLGMGFVYGHSGSDRTPHDVINRKWAQAISNEVFNGQVWVGNLANMGSMPYESHGSSCDYMYKSQSAHISGTWEIWRKPSFFASTAASTGASNVNMGVSLLALKPKSEDVASKFDYVSTNTFKVDTVLDQSKQVKIAGTPDAIQTNQAIKGFPEMHELLQTSLGKEVSEGLGLTEQNLVSLVQDLKTQGTSEQDIQVLLQDMSREQCFAYFNPVMPDHYDHTVNSFTRAILLGAEKLSSSDIAAGLA